MTTAVVERTSIERASRVVRWRHLPLAPVAGVVLGAIARVWMRWISTDPEFSWSGTIAIVVMITLFVTAQTAAAAFRGRPRGRHRWSTTVVRVVAGVLSLGIFAGAGGVMLPTVVFGGLAAWRRDWRRGWRLAVGALALLPVAFIGSTIADRGWGISWIGRMALFLGIYGAFVAAAGATIAPQRDGWRLPRWARGIGLALAVFVVLAVGVGIAGVG